MKEKNIYLATAFEVPEVGRTMICWPIIKYGKKAEPVRTSYISEVKYKGNGVYAVSTLNSTYYVLVEEVIPDL